MSEKFSYDASAKVFRRKTLTAFQKSLIYLLIIADTAISIYIVTTLSNIENTPSSLFIFSVIAPTMVALIGIIYIGTHPKGPEKDFILPGADLDPQDCATVKGSVRLKDGSLKDVEVIVPNVYGRGSLNLLDDGPDSASLGRISTPEMYDMALETVRAKYSECKWESEPTI